MKNGFRACDSDMHVYDAANLYEKYMNPKWGERIPRGQRNGKHGRVEFKLSSGRETLRAITDVIDHGQKQVAERYDFAVARDYDAVSQVEAMDREGLDVAVLFRTSPLHCDETLEAEYANDLCKAWNDWIADFCKVNSQRLKASALITLHDVDLAVDEVRRVVNQLKIRALSLCPEPINGKRIHDRYFDPLWAEIEKLEVALCFHPPARPRQDQVANKFFGHPNANIIALALRNPVELLAHSVDDPALGDRNFAHWLLHDDLLEAEALVQRDADALENFHGRGTPVRQQSKDFPFEADRARRETGVGE